MQLGMRIAAVGLLLSLGLAGCGGGDNNPVNPPPGGNLEMNSGSIGPGGNYQHQFMAEGTFPYHCSFHGGMTGSVTVQTGGAASGSVNIANSGNSGFQPGTLTVQPGATVTWTNNDGTAHTVTSH